MATAEDARREAEIPQAAGLTGEERLVWLLGDLMDAAENYFGRENPKRLGHINSSAIRILDEVITPMIDAERAKSEGLRKALQLIADGCEVSSAGDVWPSHILDPQLVARAALSASPSPRRQLTQEDVEMFDAALYASTTVVHEGELVNIIPVTTVKGETR